MIGKKINQLATELAPVSTDLTIIGDPISGVSKKITLAQLGAIFSGAVSFYDNLASFPAVGDINVIYCAKDTKKLYLWSGSAYVEVFPSQALLDTYQLRSEKGNANGYASLDSLGKVPISQLPSSLMEYLGTWNAATNTPTLANGTGDNGDVYLCNVAGIVNFGAGPITFSVGDWVIYNGTIWERSSGAVGTVTSVAASITGDSLTISGSPVTTSGTLAFAFAGTGAQYIKGDGTLATFPSIISQAQNLVTEVYNKTGATLTKGTVVYINGGQGNLPTVTKALASGDSTSAQTYGIVQADITNNNNGFVVVAGRLSDIDTQAFTEGTQLYLSSTTAGAYTSTKQYAPAHLVYVGIIVRSHPTQGIIEVKIQNGYELDELHNVAAQSPSNGDILQYVSSTSLWTKVAGTTSNIAEGSNLYYTDARSRAALSFTAGSGAYNSTTGVITIPTNNNQITNGANYITLASLSAGAGISYNNTTGVIASTITQYTDALARAAISLTTTGTSGAATYNSTTGVLNVPQYTPDLSGYVPTSRTLTINGTAYDLSADRSWSVGTVTSVAALTIGTSGTDLSSTVANGTTTPVITLNVPTASATNRGALSSTDWTTFNNKQNALTNPVTGTGTTNYLPKFTGASTIGNSSITDDGTDVTITGRVLKTGGIVSSAVGGAANQEALRIYNDNGYIGFFNSANTTRSAYIQGNTTDLTLNTSLAIPILFGTSNVTKMTLTASGNLGLGVTPSAWGAITALELGNGVSFSSYTAAAIPNGYITNNAFYHGSNWIYKVSSYPATMVTQTSGGNYAWNTAPSGTAGNAISFTQAMTLNASGNLSIGNTNDTFRLDVTGTGRFGASQVDILLNATSTSQYSRLVFQENGTEKGGMEYINSAFGTTARRNKLEIFNSGGINFVTTGNFSAPDFSLSSTGAATFSSSVTAGGNLQTNAVLTIGNQFVSGNYCLQITPSTTTPIALQGILAGTGAANIVMQASGGNVGIGTNNPQRKLHVTSSMMLSSGSAAQEFLIGDDNVRYFSLQTPSGAANLQFNVYGGSNIMTMTSGGNVGIGTTSPVTFGTRNLDVNAGSGGSAYIVARANSNGGTIELAFDTDSGYLSTKSNHPLRIRTNDVTRVLIDASGIATFSNDVKVKTLEVTNVGTDSTSSGVSTYMRITVNGQNYLIPLHGTP